MKQKLIPKAGGLKSARYQGGVGMLEVLITILVIAFGLIGMAGLQTVSIKSNNMAYYRSQVTVLTYDIVDRMRVNKAAAKNGDYNTNTPSSGTMAGNDLIEWKASAAAIISSRCAITTLPIAQVSVDSNGIATVTIQWDGDGDCRADFGNPADGKFVTQTRL